MKALAADRTGDAVDLHWTNPSKTTDGIGLTGKHGAGTLAAEICRSTSAAGDACTLAGHVPVAAGATASFHDMLPPDLRVGNLRPLHYRVRVLNAAGKGARYAAVEAVAGTVPPPVRGLTAAPAINGVALRWQPDPAANGARTVLSVERVRGNAAGPGKPVDGPSTHTDLLAVEPAAHDPGGAIDAGAKLGVEQRYTVFRMEAVRSGDHTLTARSLPAMVTVPATAKAPPPAPPLGFEAVVNTLGAPEIDLVWQPAEGAAGYLLFRAEGDGVPVQLTPQAVPGLSYADAGVRPGGHYRYTVASVDAAGTAGPRSPELAESMPLP